MEQHSGLTLGAVYNTQENNFMRYVQGARIQDPLVSALRQIYRPNPPPPEPPIDPDAFALAQANKHKPWARRWLRAHRLSFK